MKRALSLLIALASISSSFAQGFSFLKPPTLAVMDFEVSMGEIKEISKDFRKEFGKEYYGQLVSQALLSALVRQNAAEQVLLPLEAQQATVAPTYSATGPDKRTQAQSETYRRYFPPIFKIFDKKYVEAALQGNAYASKDLYAANANAYAFANLDFLVLGNVYETASYANGAPAIGFNVRVLNTKRAEELYSYIAIVDLELRELPLACARIAQFILRDILNNHCAQFKISEAQELKDKAAQAGKSLYDYLLFWQPKQVTLDDATIGDSTDAHKRQVEKDTFYWALPGQYSLSVYNRTEQQLKAVPFTLGPGEIKHVAFDESHLMVQNVALTVSGVLPTDSYTFEFKPQAQQERYRWEIDQPMRRPSDFRVSFADGKATVKGGQAKVTVEYRPATSELIIREVSPAAYQVTATSAPPSGSGSVTGWWVVSSQLSMTSQPLPVDLRGKKESALPIADFKLQAKKAVVSPRLNKVTFLVEPGFSSIAKLDIDDKANWSILWWADKEKVTVSSEYSQADWDSFPTVAYDFEITFLSPATQKYETVTFEKTFQKTDLEPGKDTIVVLELEKIRAGIEAAKRDSAQAKPAAAQAASTAAGAAKPAVPATGASATASTASGKAVVASTAAKPTAQAAAPAVKTPMVQLGVGFGGGSLTCYEVAGTYPDEYDIEHTVSGSDLAINAALLFPVSASAALGFGIYTHFVTFDEDEAVDAGIDEDGLTGVAATLNMAFGAPGASSRVLLDVGYGTGFALGFGISAKKPGSKAGFYLRVGVNSDGVPDLDEEIWDDYYSEWEEFPATNTSFSILFGLLLG